MGFRGELVHFTLRFGSKECKGVWGGEETVPSQVVYRLH